jgi:hypothetical protein
VLIKLELFLFYMNYTSYICGMEIGITSTKVRSDVREYCRRERVSLLGVYVSCNLSVGYRSFMYFMEGKIRRMNGDDLLLLDRYVNGRNKNKN